MKPAGKDWADCTIRLTVSSYADDVTLHPERSNSAEEMTEGMYLGRNCTNIVQEIEINHLAVAAYLKTGSLMKSLSYRICKFL